MTVRHLRRVPRGSNNRRRRYLQDDENDDINEDTTNNDDDGKNNDPNGNNGDNKNENKNNNKNKNPETSEPSQGPTQRPRTRAPTQRPVFAPTMPSSPTFQLTTPSSASPPSTAMKPSFISFQGTVDLSWSQIQTSSDVQFSDYMVPFLKDWIAQEYLCSQPSILLTSDLALESDCATEGTPLAADSKRTRAILWNAPDAIASSERLDGTDLPYARWTLSFPVYDEYSEGLETHLQEGLDGLILRDRIEPAFRSSILSVVGNEMATFGDREVLDRSDGTLPPFAAPYLAPTALPTATVDDAKSVVMVQSIGGFLALIHTLLLIMLHFFGKPYLQKRILDEKRKTNRKLFIDGLKLTHTESSEVASTDGSSGNLRQKKKIQVEQRQRRRISKKDDNQSSTYGNNPSDGLGLLLMATNRRSLNQRDSSGRRPSPNKTTYHDRNRSLWWCGEE